MKTGFLRIIQASSALFAAGIFFVMALIARDFIMYRYAMPSAQPFRAKEAAASVKTNIFADYEVIGGAGIFGEAKISMIGAPVVAGAAGAAPVDSGDITLLGTVVAKSGGYAVFNDRRAKKQAVLGKGDEVFSLGVLSEVDEKSAKVISKGTVLTFYLPEARPSGSPLVKQSGARAQDGRAQGGSSILSRRTGDAEWTIDQRALNEVLNDMGKVLTDARLMPYSENGRVSGFRVTEIRPNGVFSIIGLQNGDVLQKINDYAIDSPEKGVQLLSGLKGESDISLDIIRNGTPQRLNYRIR